GPRPPPGDEPRPGQRGTTDAGPVPPVRDDARLDAGHPGGHRPPGARGARHVHVGLADRRAAVPEDPRRGGGRRGRAARAGDPQPRDHALAPLVLAPRPPPPAPAAASPPPARPPARPRAPP